VIGLYGTLKNGAEDDIVPGDPDSFGDDQWWGVQAGVNIDIFGFKLGGAVGEDRVGDTRRDFANIGIGAALGPVNASVGYGYIFDANEDFNDVTGIDKGSNLVFSADVALAPGLVLAGDVSRFDNDSVSDVATGTGDTGWTAVGSVRLAF
jgi:hypothetical protein